MKYGNLQKMKALINACFNFGRTRTIKFVLNIISEARKNLTLSSSVITRTKIIICVTNRRYQCELNAIEHALNFSLYKSSQYTINRKTNFFFPYVVVKKVPNRWHKIIWFGVRHWFKSLCFSANWIRLVHS